ncbi:MAG: cadherin-like beta sandwich domain-containing protein [Clostridia bacterium]
MEKTKKRIAIAIICSMIFSLCMINMPSYAENETTNNTATNSAATSTNTSNKTNTTTQTSTNTTSTTKKSSNANLSNLGIKPYDFSGFKSGTTSYSATVPNDTTSVEVYATAQSSSAKVSGIGTKGLEVGTNKIDVVVTAEDGTTKTYTINITRQEGTESNTEIVQVQYSGDGLASLKVGDLTLSPSFDTTIYEYTVKYIGEDTKLDITATATDPYYTVDIVGNENLQEGENIINILVSDPDDENVAAYQITVNKSLVDEEAVAREKEEQKRKIIIVGVIAAVVVIIIIIIGIIKYRRNQEWDDDYEYDEDDDDYENEYEKNNNQLEEYDDNMNYIGDEEEIELTKEQAREKFLNNYNNDIEEEEELIEEMTKRKKHKGKRFK